MADILKGLAGKSTFLIAWTFAAAIMVGAVVLFLLPAALDVGLATFLKDWSESTAGLVLLAVVVLLGVHLSRYLHTAIQASRRLRLAPAPYELGHQTATRSKAASARPLGPTSCLDSD